MKASLDNTQFKKQSIPPPMKQLPLLVPKSINKNEIIILSSDDDDEKEERKDNNHTYNGRPEISNQKDNVKTEHQEKNMKTEIPNDNEPIDLSEDSNMTNKNVTSLNKHFKKEHTQSNGDLSNVTSSNTDFPKIDYNQPMTEELYFQNVNTINKREGELLKQLKATQDTGAILRKRLDMREKNVREVEDKINLISKSMNVGNGNISPTKKIILEEAKRNLIIIRKKREQTKDKLDLIVGKIKVNHEKFNNFERKKEEALPLLKKNLEITNRNSQTGEIVTERRNILKEKSDLEAMLKSGTLSSSTFLELNRELDRKLSDLNVPRSNKPTEPELQNKIQMAKKVGPDLFIKSLDTAKALLAKNSSRTEFIKRMLYSNLDLLRSYKEYFEANKFISRELRTKVREAAELLFANGVKMPIVFETLQDYGVHYLKQNILAVDKRAQYFKSLQVARELVANSNRPPDVKFKIYDSLKVLEELRLSIDAGIPLTFESKRKVSTAVLSLKDHGLKMNKLYMNLEKYGIAITSEDLARQPMYSQKNEPYSEVGQPYSLMSQDPWGIMSNNGNLNIQRGSGIGDMNAFNSDNQFRVANILAGDDQEHIRELLQNVKQTESESEGETLTPEDMTVNLLKHQKIGLHWLLNVEASKKKGGLLADDMGLGKTVQGIALMLANRSKDQACKTNLIVAPVAVLRVWGGELETKIKKEANFSAFIYGGGDKLATWKELSEYDAIMVSYPTLAIEFKKHWPASLGKDQKQLPAIPQLAAMNSLKKKDEYFSPFFCNESTFYRIILDEGQNIKNKKTRAAKASLLLPRCHI